MVLNCGWEFDLCIQSIFRTVSLKLLLVLVSTQLPAKPDQARVRRTREVLFHDRCPLSQRLASPFSTDHVFGSRSALGQWCHENVFAQATQVWSKSEMFQFQRKSVMFLS